MSFIAFRKNKIISKISEFTVFLMIRSITLFFLIIVLSVAWLIDTVGLKPVYLTAFIHGRIQRGGTGGPDSPTPPPPPPPPPPKNHKNIGFLCNSGPDPLKNHKATNLKPAFNVRPSSARQPNAILMAFRWLADDGPFIAVFGSSIPLSTRKKLVIKFGPPLKKSSVHVIYTDNWIMFQSIMSPPFRVGRHIVFPQASVCLSDCHKSYPLYNLKTV